MIKFHDFSKVYPGNKGVFDIDFTVEQGEIFGFLGPNGAGKTTAIRQLLGFTNATRGYCTIKGMETRKEADKIQRLTGYVPGEISFFENMTGLEFMEFIRALRKMKGRGRIKELTELFELESDRKIRKMSKGMKQKVGLITAFMHDPEILILDEPTSGLDPLMQNRFVDLIISEKKRGKTIFMSSHIFDEVDKTCDRAAIIREGRIVDIEDLLELKSRLKKSYIVTVSSQEDILRIVKSNLEHQYLGDNRFEVFVGTDFNDFLRVLSNCNIKNLDSVSRTLDQIFITYYNGGVKQ